ncbi:hypothetical protein EAI_14429 [Harpegnathos saltator]|uniref:Uncharacterized protein n=1 Tax=Harpegnathos saltator TaxID=610380 RepID=E2C3R5_HARSA|nr:hypothetical protein EAI_14429 [Harpegnathos saltator]
MTRNRNRRCTTGNAGTTLARKLNLTLMTLLPSTVVAAAINAEATIPTNPSTVVVPADPAAVTTVKPHHHVYNVTGYLVEHDELDHSILASFSDIQTVLLACISTLLPLIIALGIAFGVRHVWRKYRNDRDSGDGLPWYKSACTRNNAAVESQRRHSHSGNVPVQAATTRVLSAQDVSLANRVVSFSNNRFSTSEGV